MCYRELVSSAVRREAKLRADFELYASRPSGPSGSLIDRRRRDRSAAGFGLDLSPIPTRTASGIHIEKKWLPCGRDAIRPLALSTRSCERSALPHASGSIKRHCVCITVPFRRRGSVSSLPAACTGVGPVEGLIGIPLSREHCRVRFFSSIYTLRT